MNKTLQTSVLGYPRIGEFRELKRATESYWKGAISLEELQKVGSELRANNWKKLQAQNITFIPSNDFSFYDQVLDMSCMLGNIPDRFNFSGNSVTLDLMFNVARGVRESVQKKEGQSAGAAASDMTKWFDTNYHYIVPEFTQKTQFRYASSKVVDQFKEALALGIKTRPVLVGPMTYLKIGKVMDNSGVDKYALLSQIIPIYQQIIKDLEAAGAEWIQIDEPIFALDLTAAERELLASTVRRLSEASKVKLLVASYFGELQDNLNTFVNLPVEALHVDAVRAEAELDDVVAALPSDKVLSVGVVNGRNIWKNDYKASLALIKKAVAKLGQDRVIVSSSCSLMHSPVTLANETQLDAELKSWLSFADQKVEEVKVLGELAVSGVDGSAAYKENQAAIENRNTSRRIHDPAVKTRLANVKESDFHRTSPFAGRQKVQRDHLKLPAYPTTTIGSLPQTPEVRQKRAQFKKGELSQAEYDAFIASEIENSVRFQEEIGIDLLVHGEFERNDMVEYFGEQLQGFGFTQNGWVQSYGSRYVKPPFIFGDVARPTPMTVKWSEYAQKLTEKPMKGMLTGPITILQWSFVRDDQPRSTTTMQIALAILDEVQDLEKAGISAIQIDEPAIREGLPLRRSEWNAYLEWAVRAFKLSSSNVKDDTQIHTHMCYSEFNDIISSIADMDADVISIETSRSNMELLEAFVDFNYPNEIGPGVYDIHSPRVPSVDEMAKLIEKARDVLPAENIWVNPDCGLKTRQWIEVEPALKNMVDSAKKLRAR